MDEKLLVGNYFERAGRLLQIDDPNQHLMLCLLIQFLCLTTIAGQSSPDGLALANRTLRSQSKAITTATLSAVDNSRGNEQQPARGWQYEQKRGSDKATLRSVNAIQFAYPHTQQENVTLGIRSSNGDTYLYLETANGLFTRSFQNGTAQVQFDQQRPATYALSAAANGRANIVFFDDAERLLRQLQQARSMIVRLQFAGQASRALTFQTAGLRWNH